MWVWQKEVDSNGEAGGRSGAGAGCTTAHRGPWAPAHSPASTKRAPQETQIVTENTWAHFTRVKAERPHRGLIGYRGKADKQACWPKTPFSGERQKNSQSFQRLGTSYL